MVGKAGVGLSYSCKKKKKLRQERAWPYHHLALSNTHSGLLCQPFFYGFGALFSCLGLNGCFWPVVELEKRRQERIGTTPVSLFCLGASILNLPVLFFPPLPAPTTPLPRSKRRLPSETALSGRHLVCILADMPSNTSRSAPARRPTSSNPPLPYPLDRAKKLPPSPATVSSR